MNHILKAELFELGLGCDLYRIRQVDTLFGHIRNANNGNASVAYSALLRGGKQRCDIETLRKREK